jgi:hypothetical protein
MLGDAINGKVTTVSKIATRYLDRQIGLERDLAYISTNIHGCGENVTHKTRNKATTKRQKS